MAAKLNHLSALRRFDCYIDFFLYITAHIFFDDAFEDAVDSTIHPDVNDYVRTLISVIDKAKRYT